MRSGIIHRPEVIFAIQPEDRDLSPHQSSQLFAKLPREKKFASGENRYALAILAPDTEESVLLFLQLTQSARGFIETFIFNGIVVHLDRLSCGSRRSVRAAGCW